MKFLTASYLNGEVILKSEQAASKEGDYILEILVTEVVNGREIKHDFQVPIIVTGVKTFVPDWIDLNAEEPTD